MTLVLRDLGAHPWVDQYVHKEKSNFSLHDLHTFDYASIARVVSLTANG